MRHAFATFFFVASIAGFGGVANALPIASTAGTDVSKSTALKQEADDALFRGGSIRGGSIALDQGANQWNHRAEAARGEAVKLATIRWNGYTDNTEADKLALRKKKHWIGYANDKLALDQGANQWNHRGDDDWGPNPRRVI